MFEAKLQEGYIFKRIVEAIKDLVTDVNLDVSPSGKWIIIIVIWDPIPNTLNSNPITTSYK